MATTAVVAEPVESVEPTMGSAQQVAEDEGLSFTPTPGPGYSEGATSTTRSRPLRPSPGRNARPHGVRWMWERVSHGVPEEDALLLAEEVRHQAELSDVARNLAGRLPPSTLPDASLTPVASMTSMRGV
jgi:hypothetical protein